MAFPRRVSNITDWHDRKTIYKKSCPIHVRGSLLFNKYVKSNNIQNKYELIRFCNKINISVIGGASRLLKYFIKTYQPKEIISYADRSWSMGNLYEKLGFKFLYDTKPNYYYIIDKIFFKN